MSRPVSPSDTWVPPGPGEATSGRLDLTAQIPRLRVRAWRAVVIAVLWAAVLGGGITGLVEVNESAQRLLETGTRVTGTVLRESEPDKGPWTIEVSYRAGEVTRTAEISLDSHRRLTPGQPVTVTYDPSDPGRVRTPQDSNVSEPLEVTFVAAAITALFAAPLSAAAAVGWFRRHRAVRRSGWHAASVLVTEWGRARLITVDYLAGGAITLRAVGYKRPRARRRARQAWIGGAAAAMVVLLPREQGERPRLVPAKARAPRSESSVASTSVPKGRSGEKRAAWLLAVMLPVAITAASLVRRRRISRSRR
ncbi:MAG TPA: DUF3592 domain-containing protein [Amycolatopsis sp.]|nr:DUF3592 domain-containing protein [Amycolatopsis sp.]